MKHLTASLRLNFVKFQPNIFISAAALNCKPKQQWRAAWEQKAFPTLRSHRIGWCDGNAAFPHSFLNGTAATVLRQQENTNSRLTFLYLCLRQAASTSWCLHLFQPIFFSVRKAWVNRTYLLSLKHYKRSCVVVFCPMWQSQPSLRLLSWSALSIPYSARLWVLCIIRRTVIEWYIFTLFLHISLTRIWGASSKTNQLSNSVNLYIHFHINS